MSFSFIFSHYKQTCMAGLNFANESEANHFANVVNDKIRRRIDLQNREANRVKQYSESSGVGITPTSQGVISKYFVIFFMF